MSLSEESCTYSSTLDSEESEREAQTASDKAAELSVQPPAIPGTQGASREDLVTLRYPRDSQVPNYSRQLPEHGGRE